MDILDNLFSEVIQKQVKLPDFAINIIKRNLAKKGVKLTKQQKNILRNKFENINLGNKNFQFDLELSNKQIAKLGIKKNETLHIDIEESNEDLKELCNEFFQEITDMIPNLTKKISQIILSDLRKKAPEMLEEHFIERKGFENRLFRDWKKPFNLLEMFIVISQEAGDDFNNEFRKKPDAKINFVNDVITRLQARGCQIANEILVLLKSGYADGAHARWRTLHEISVIGSFIQKYGNEIAEKYLLHNSIESYKAAILLQKYYLELGEEPLSQEEFDEVKNTRDKLISRFGKSFDNKYGWASSVLNKDNPSFSEIEEITELNHIRPVYKLASNNVHAEPKGILFKLGLLSNDLLLTGPSNIGFTDPAQWTAISLGQITSILLTTNPTIDNLVICNMLFTLQSEIGRAFINVQKRIEKREIHYNRRISEKILSNDSK
ncbi:MAG: hypothetical protein C0412_12650 [Flavobacterium sp.]|nr:hypothetical protein [Flavobacterium sp.]